MSGLPLSSSGVGAAGMGAAWSTRPFAAVRTLDRLSLRKSARFFNRPIVTGLKSG
jgi:hypothetical protein